ncbi:MAG TPA: prephenate dehydrogenase/arogenate dehydrogenase family protein, partial [Firmicutes bacterium]|nr:prephenate dehydrogenase/arogenate dehydrogenase family protein [Bacillota bacterium]
MRQIAAAGDGMTALFRRVALLGVGMVGGSLGRALLVRGLAGEVTGYDQSPEVPHRALALGAVTNTAETVAAAVDGCDLVVLAAPVLAAQELLAQAAPCLAPGCIVTDVCSTKAEIMERAAKVLPPAVSFVGGHPMAGSEKQGVEALAENLFENAVYVLCGGEETARAKVTALVRGLGALPVEMSPQRHDYVVAAVSHLPHLAAVALTKTVAGLQQADELLPLAAGGFRDTTRVAMGSPQMWLEICLSNSKQLL